MGPGDPLERAAALFRAGQRREAHAVLAPAMTGGQGGVEAHQLMGLILHSLGDLAGCERELRTAVRMTPISEVAVQTLARMLFAQGRDEDAVAVNQAFADAAPGHPGAAFSLAAALYTAGGEAEAEAAGRRAIALGMDDVQAWLFLARLYNLQGRVVEAEDAYRTAVARDPLSPDAQRELAQLIWMRTADAGQASALLDAAPPTGALTAIKVKLLQDADLDAQACTLVVERADRDPSLNVLAARVALRVDPELADRRIRLAPPWVNALARAKGEIEIDLALGRGFEAARRAEALNAAHPNDHYVTALLATAWRMTGDGRYGGLHDYGRLVKAYRIDPPPGWSSLEAYLADLERALDRLHGDLTHPVGQSLRHGSQTMRSLLDYPDPEIKAFFRAIDAPIRKHIAAIGEGARLYAVAGAWSVRLRSRGFHTDHVHPEGWLSSAFYVRLPEALERGQEGWIRFGHPGTPTRPPMQAEHVIRPEPGMLVLFPAYMWHGTVPFDSDETRLTCAFDLVRA